MEVEKGAADLRICGFLDKAAALKPILRLGIGQRISLFYFLRHIAKSQAKTVEAAPLKSSENKVLTKKMTTQPAPWKQRILDLGIEVERDVNGIEMGVLENGIAYLTQTGLSIVTGANRKTLYELTNEWEKQYDNPIQSKNRITYLRDKLSSLGYDEPKLYIEIMRKGSPDHAYPDVVCTVLLEYFAFEAQVRNETAMQNFRRFATYGLQNFIYDALGYIPVDGWRHYHDRVSLLKNSAPFGYFIVFHEMTGLIVDLITSGLTVSDKTIPDISVGRAWNNYRKSQALAARHGERIEYPHNDPDYYPQARSNPQEAKAYPDSALPEFRRWFREEYLPTKFPPYVLRKAPLLRGGIGEAQAIAKNVQPQAHKEWELKRGG